MKEFIKGIVFCLLIIVTLIGINMLAEVISKTIKPEIMEEKEEKKEVKETITNKDIAKAIASLNYKQLDELDAKIRYLSELKKNKKLILDKDIA